MCEAAGQVVQHRVDDPAQQVRKWVRQVSLSPKRERERSEERDPPAVTEVEHSQIGAVGGEEGQALS